jgi:ankyrin repeat protein
VRKGAHLNEKNKEFLTPLHVAADNSHYDVMDALLHHGAKVNALDGLGQTGKEYRIVEDQQKKKRYRHVTALSSSAVPDVYIIFCLFMDYRS